jgi:hypothetical protein
MKSSRLFLSFKYVFVCAMLLCGAVLIAAEPSPSADTSTAISPAALPENLSDYKDAEAGYSFKVPAGYTRLTQDQIRVAFKGLSESLGKDISERTPIRPPAYFQGPLDPAHPKLLPPGMAVAFTALAEQIDPAQMPKYRESYEAYLRKDGESAGDIQVDVIQVGGIPSLRIEHDIFSPVDNSRMRMLKISVPGHERRYDIVFSYYGEQAAAVKTAVDTVLRSFTLADSAMPSASSRGWVRVALYTVGGLVLGLLLGLIFGAIAGKNPQPATQKP